MDDHGVNRRKWATAVASLDPSIVLDPIRTRPLNSPWVAGTIKASHAGAFAAAGLVVDGAESFVAVSAYGLCEDSSETLKAGHVNGSLNRMLSDLTPLIDSPRGKRMLIAGDMNFNATQWSPRTRGARWGPMHDGTLARFADLRFVDVMSASVPAGRGPLAGCPCAEGENCRHVRTFRLRNKRESVPSQLDWCFATKDLASAVTCAPIGDDDPAWTSATTHL